MNKRTINVKSRQEVFVTQSKSEITLEVPSSDNAFLSERQYTHGYDTLDLMQSCDPLDVFFLLFQSELPTPAQKERLRLLAVALINLGPRHAASRTAANAACGRTDPVHIAPIGLLGMGGEYGGAKEVELAMRFLSAHHDTAAEAQAHTCFSSTFPEDGEHLPAPGFGTDFGGQSPYLHNIKDRLMVEAPPQGYLHWAERFSQTLQAQHAHCGWRLAGLAAACLLDLGFSPRLGSGLFQLLSAPGAFAHGIAFANKPITELPFLKDEDYDIENT